MEIRQEFTLELARAARTWRARLDERLRHTGLTQARWVTLAYLSLSGGGLTQRALAELVGVEGPTLGRCLDSLEAQGLIERRPDDRDRRAKLVHLTESAGPVLEEINHIAANLRHELLSEVTTEELLTCVAIFRSIERKMKRPENPDTEQELG